ncbi:MAG: ABC transporter permease [Myxococcales bacterium]|nr:ABC transporter permease [Myxococcales bacterium]
MTSLHTKLWRDLNSLKGQVLTIALVVACGIASYVTMRSTWSSLYESKDTYFEKYRFADVFASLKRAPESLVPSVEAIPGVSRAYSRVVQMATVPIPELTEVARAYLVSLPANREPALNGVYLRSGRLPRLGTDTEAVVVESFAKAHGLMPGDSIPVVINGKLRDVRIVGVGLSPEYVFLGGMGDFVPDDKQIAALWIQRDVLAPAFEMAGAFNDLAIDLQPGADEKAVMRQLDLLLEPYGGLGAISRHKQISNFLLESELAGLDQNATVVPAIFLAVAAFLLNIVLSRLILLQRQQIAALKALGYSTLSVTFHYLQLAFVIVALGSILGLLLGAWLGGALTELYAGYFRFPTLVFRVSADVAFVGVGVSFLAAGVGAIASVLQVTRLSPAEAMRPAAPARYRRGLLDRLGIAWIFGVSSMMVMRELRRRPIRLALSSLGIAAAVGIMVVGRFGSDSMDNLIDVIFHKEQRGDLTVAFLQPQPIGAEHELEMLPGVLDAEGVRMVPVRFSSGPRWRESVVTGMPTPARLRGLIDRNGVEATLPTKGLAMSAKLAEILSVKVGDEVEAEVREGKRPRVTLPVATLIDDSFGLQAYMNIDDLHRRLGQELSISLVQLKVDPDGLDELRRRLKQMPAVAQVTIKSVVVERFKGQSAETMRIMTFLLSLFGAIIAIGVVYNNARVSLSMRARDLASLRVLGFSQREVSSILLGELAVQMIVGIPIGLVLGQYWCQALMNTNDPETYRFAVHVSTASYAFATVVAMGAAVVSALLVRRKLSRQDLIEVLKTRE